MEWEGKGEGAGGGAEGTRPLTLFSGPRAALNKPSGRLSPARWCASMVTPIMVTPSVEGRGGTIHPSPARQGGQGEQTAGRREEWTKTYTITFSSTNLSQEIRGNDVPWRRRRGLPAAAVLALSWRWRWWWPAAAAAGAPGMCCLSMLMYLCIFRGCKCQCCCCCFSAHAVSAPAAVASVVAAASATVAAYCYFCCDCYRYHSFFCICRYCYC